MPISKTAQAGKKKKRIALLYDVDLLGQSKIIRVDIILSHGNIPIETPVTTRYSLRFVGGNPSAIPKRTFEPRQLTCCFSYQQTKEVIRTVYNPYVPTNPDFKLLIKELIGYTGIVTIDYTGESKEKELEEWL